MRKSIPMIGLQAVMAVAAFWFAGCAAPEITVKNRATGETQRTFTSEQVPAVTVEQNGGAIAGGKLRVYRLPERTLIATEIFARNYGLDPLYEFTPDYVNGIGHARGGIGETRPSSPLLSLRELPAGDYVAELSNGGKVERSAPFTIEAGPDAPAACSPATMSAAPRVLFVGIFRPEERSTEELDERVGLTAGQRKSAMKIFAAEDRAKHQLPRQGGTKAERDRIERDFQGQIRALLTPGQREQFDAELRRQAQEADARAV